MKKNFYTIIAIGLLGLTFVVSSCEDSYFDVPNTVAVTPDAVSKAAEADVSKVQALVDGIYNMLVQYDLYNTSHDAFGYMAVMHATDMMTEDIVMAALHWFNYDYLHDNRGETYRRTNVIWRYFYTAIANANNVLSLTSPESDNPDLLAVRGQALALRAVSYFYLIQLYQHVSPVAQSGNRPGVPLYYAENEGKPNVLSRAPVADVLAQIESDLTKAIANLDGWSRTSKNKIDKAVANGLLARYYLLTEQWNKAAETARAARADYPVMPATRLTSGFMDINDTEWMWGYDHNAETATLYASFFSMISNAVAGYSGIGYAPRLIDKRLYESIPETDKRKDLFQKVDTVMGTVSGFRDSVTYKREPPALNINTGAIGWKRDLASLKFGWNSDGFTMDYLYMRASEMVLIEAEAKAHSGDGAGAAVVLKELMEKRDTSWNETTVTVDDVWHQRRIELWGEGFAMFDLKRLQKGIDRTYEGSNHLSSAKLKIEAGDKRWIYKIPLSEIQENEAISESDQNE